ncbi:uncharacterized protein LOC125945611 [Dermacentor silvarum]|uniref:uncharacterized protein LOC125945611 n=1 Tax=Dermacentor silvarum TaxID=543639 RepID=UPI002101139E|nr:uncharacterized protein LOC125945611 [Dermacentor silvarum]
MIERLICVALLFVCRTYAYRPMNIPLPPDCMRVLNASSVCAMKSHDPMSKEIFEQTASQSFGDNVSDCVEQSTPVIELDRGCTSGVAITIAAHCVRAAMFGMAPRNYKHRVLLLLDELVECMATELQQPLPLLRSAVESTK